MHGHIGFGAKLSTNISVVFSDTCMLHPLPTENAQEFHRKAWHAPERLQLGGPSQVRTCRAEFCYTIGALPKLRPQRPEGDILAAALGGEKSVCTSQHH